MLCNSLYTDPKISCVVTEISTGELFCTAMASVTIDRGTCLLVGCVAKQSRVYVVSKNDDKVEVTHVGEFEIVDNESGINTVVLSTDPEEPYTINVISGSESGGIAYHVVTLNSSSVTEPCDIKKVGSVPSAHSGEPVCTLSFLSPTAVISGGKDGNVNTYTLTESSIEANSTITISIPVPAPIKGARPENDRQKALNKQVLVRGIAVNVKSGIFYTIASGRRGSAYLDKWLIKDVAGSEVKSEVKSVSRAAVNSYPASGIVILPPADPKHSKYSVLSIASVDGSVSTFIDFHATQNIEVFTGDPADPSKGIGWLKTGAEGKLQCHDLPITQLCLAPQTLSSGSNSEGGCDVVTVSPDNKVCRIKVYGNSVVPSSPIISWFILFMVILVAFFAKVIVEGYCNEYNHDITKALECVGKVLEMVAKGEVGVGEVFKKVSGNVGEL